jgi:hypothetical protein
MVTDISPEISLNMFKFLYALLVGSALVIFMTVGLTDPTAINALRGAYFVILCSLIFIFILIRNSLTLTVTLAFLPIWTSIVFIIILLYKYYDRITVNKVSDYYSTFMNLTNILLTIQIYILLSEISIKSFQDFKLTPKMVAILKLFSVLTTVSVITLGIILKHYTTDC